MNQLAIKEAGLPAGIAAGLAVGVGAGFVNGWLSTRLAIPSFLTTLAMNGYRQGCCDVDQRHRRYSHSQPDLRLHLRRGKSGTNPDPAGLDLGGRRRGHLFWAKTTFGRRVLATGGNETAASYSGIDTQSIKMRVLVLSSVVAAIAGMLYAGRLQSGRFQFGEGDELSVIAAAVLGGTSLFGGRGTVIGTIAGALMIGIINNGLILLGLEYSQQLIARGLIIILAVALSHQRKRQ